MKKKKIFLLSIILFLCATSYGYAQEKRVNFGIKGGVNLSSMSGGFFEDKSSIVGFNAGLNVEFKLANTLYLKSGIELTSKGVKEKNSYITLEDLTAVKVEKTSRPLYLQIPIHLAYKLSIDESRRIVFYGGPFVAYGLSGKRTVKGYSNWEADFFGKQGLAENRFDVGLGAGVGYEFGKYSINAGCDFGLIDVMGGIDGGATRSYVARTMNTYMSVGYRF